MLNFRGVYTQNPVHPRVPTHDLPPRRCFSHCPCTASGWSDPGTSFQRGGWWVVPKHGFGSNGIKTPHNHPMGLVTLTGLTNIFMPKWHFESMMIFRTSRLVGYVNSWRVTFTYMDMDGWFLWFSCREICQIQTWIVWGGTLPKRKTAGSRKMEP